MASAMSAKGKTNGFSPPAIHQWLKGADLSAGRILQENQPASAR